MRNVSSLFLPFVLLLAVYPNSLNAHIPPQEQLQDSVDLVLAHYAEASGGDALAEIRNETRRGEIIRGTSGQVPCEIISMAPRMWRWEQSLAWGDQFAYGFDGTNGWVQDAQGVGRMSPRQVLDFQLLFDITAPLRMREMYPEMTMAGSERNGDTEATVLLARSIDGLTTELAFDRETGLLIRAGEIFLEDYRDVDGVMRPFRFRLGNMLRMKFTEIRHDLDVEETLFTQPTTALAARDPVLYRQHDQVEVSIDALDACIGEYQLPSGPVISITREGRHLFFKTPNSPNYEIFPMSEVDFFMRFNHGEFHFLKDEAGRVTKLALGADRSRTAEKIR